MKIQPFLKTTLFAVCCFVMSTVMASTTDGMTPADETICDNESGKSFGICNAYCEAMDCDNPDRKASNKACEKKFEQWLALNGEGVPLPCEDASLAISKSASSDGEISADGILTVNAPATVNYTIEVTNTGSVGIEVTSIQDDKLNSLDCTPNFPVIIEPTEVITCQESVSYDIPDTTHVNVAKASGVTIGGFSVNEVEDSLTVMVEAQGATCPCLLPNDLASNTPGYWDNQIPGFAPPIDLDSFGDAESCRDSSISSISVFPDGTREDSPRYVISSQTCRDSLGGSSTSDSRNVQNTAEERNACRAYLRDLFPGCSGLVDE